MYPHLQSKWNVERKKNDEVKMKKNFLWTIFSNCSFTKLLFSSFFLTFFQTDSRKTGWNNLAICSIRELSGNCCRLWLDLLTISNVRMTIEYCGRWKHREKTLNIASDASSFTLFLSFSDAVWLWYMLYALGTENGYVNCRMKFEMVNVENARKMRRFRRSVTNEMKFFCPQLAP